MGFDPKQLFAEMDTPAVSAEIAGDAQAGKEAGLGGVPLVFINRKYMPRWRKPGVIEDVLEEASQ